MLLNRSLSCMWLRSAWKPAGHFDVTATLAQPRLDATPDKWLFFEDDGKNYQYWVPSLPGPFLESLKRCQVDGGVLFDLPQVCSYGLRLKSYLRLALHTCTAAHTGG